MIHISASLLAANYACLGEEVRRAEAAGVDSFHFDMMDGHYVPNLALAPDHLKALRCHSNLPFYAHLELENPDEVLSNFELVQADMIIVQWDTLADPVRTFDRIRSLNMEVGLGLNPDDTFDEAAQYFGDLDLLLLLGVYPGFGGQVMQPGMLEKITRARSLAGGLERHLTIAVDGGVNSGNAALLAGAGADCLIMGTALFEASDMAQIIGSIRGSAAESPRR